MSKSILKIHQEVLDTNRQQLLERLLPCVKGFILGGGTALALALAHRKSFDFDFFSSSPLKKNLLEKLSHVVKIGNISVDTTDELTFYTDNDIKVTFLYYPFPHAFPPEIIENGLQVFSVKDIAIKKAYAIGRRGEYRDYFDVYTILKEKYISLTEIISLAKKIYGSIFEEKLFLQQLVYFDDLLDFQIIPVGKPVPKPEEAKSFLENLVKNYVY